MADARGQIGRASRCQNATNPDVKKFAQRMVDEHSKANRELKSVAANKGITMPSDPDAKSKQQIEDSPNFGAPILTGNTSTRWLKTTSRISRIPEGLPKPSRRRCQGLGHEDASDPQRTSAGSQADSDQGRKTLTIDPVALLSPSPRPRGEGARSKGQHFHIHRFLLSHITGLRLPPPLLDHRRTSKSPLPAPVHADRMTPLRWQAGFKPPSAECTVAATAPREAASGWVYNLVPDRIARNAATKRKHATFLVLNSN